jgi:N-methylhydantoinase A
MVTVDLAALRTQGVASLAEAFEAEHERTYGHRFPGARTVQIVSLHVQGAIPTFDRETYAARTAQGKAPGDRPKSIRSAYFGTMGALATPVIGRADLAATPRSGPLIVEEYDGTTVVPPDASARLDAFGNILIALS